MELLIAFALLFALLALGTPVALSLGIAGSIGLLLIDGFSITEASLASLPFNATSSYSLTVIPMFLLLGVFATKAGLATALFAAANRYLGWLPGGLGVSSIAASAGFSAVSGSSVATSAMLGPVAVNEMRRYGYRDGFACGIIAAAGTLGVLIPPSVILVVYAIIANQSVSAMLLAGIIPGIVSAVVMAAVVSIVFQFGHGRDPDAPTPPRATREDLTSNLRSDLTAVLAILLLFAVVVGGMYTGWFTATEAGSIGALVAFLLFLIANRRGGLLGMSKQTWGALKESAITTAFLFAVVIGASIFSSFIVRSGMPRQVGEWVTGLGLSLNVLVIVVLLLMVPLGMFLDPYSILLIVIPITFPVLSAMEVDGIWFGILLVKAIELSLITPPVGLNVFTVAGVTKVPAEKVFQGVWLFYIVDVILVAIFFAFPEIVTWLPDRVR